MKKIRQDIVNNIRALCESRKIRQADIAKYLGVSESSVSNWLKGSNSIDIENLVALCTYFEITLDQACGLSPIDIEHYLSQEEEKLLSVYRLLNESGKALLIDVANAFADSPDLQI